MSRAHVILLCAIVFLFSATLCAGPGWLSFYALLCEDGLIAAAWVTGAGLFGGAILRFTRVRTVRSLAIVTSAALGLGCFSLAALGLGLAGWLNRFTAVAMPISGVLLFTLDLFRRHGNFSLEGIQRSIETWLKARSPTWWVWPLAMPALGLASVAAAFPPGILWRNAGDPHPYDVMEYHLQIPREWYEAGRITQPTHNVYGYFPFNVEMQFLLAMHVRGGPWAGMYMAQYLSLAHMVLAVAAIYGAARAMAPDTDTPIAPALAAAAAAGVPWIAMLGSVAYNECGLLLYSTLAVGWVMQGMPARFLQRNSEHLRDVVQSRAYEVGSPGDKREELKERLLERQAARAEQAAPARLDSAAIAGCLAGLACSSKYTGAVLAIALTYLVLFHVSHSPSTRLWRHLLFIISCAVALSPWLIRNSVWTGNPVFPMAMKQLGGAHLAQAQQARWDRGHSRPPDAQGFVSPVEALVNRGIGDRQYGYGLWLVAVLAGIGSWRVHWYRAALLIGLLAVLAAFWVFATHLQPRFFILGVPLAALLISLHSGARAMRLVIGVAAVLSVLLGFIILVWRFNNDVHREPQPRAVVQDLREFMLGLDAMMLPDELTRLIESNAKIALVGDAAAFTYRLPMSHLKYRTIFDITAPPGATMLTVDDWLGPDAASIRQDHYILINRAEVERLLKTYGTDLPQKLSDEFDGPVLIPPRGR